MLGLLDDNKLFERAKMNLTHLLGSYDNEGIHVTQATRGGKAMGYHNAVTVTLGNISEQFYAIGYDFLEHRMPRSNIKVKTNTHERSHDFDDDDTKVYSS